MSTITIKNGNGNSATTPSNPAGPMSAPKILKGVLGYGIPKPVSYELNPQISKLIGSGGIRRQGRRQNAFGIASLRQRQQPKLPTARQVQVALAQEKLAEAATTFVAATIRESLADKLGSVDKLMGALKPRETVHSRLGVTNGRITKRGPDGVPSGVVNCIGRGRMGLRRNTEGDRKVISSGSLVRGRARTRHSSGGGRNNDRRAWGKDVTEEELDAEMERYNAERRAKVAADLDAQLDSYLAGRSKAPRCLTPFEEVEMTEIDLNITDNDK